MPRTAHLPAPDIAFDAQGTARSVRFDDVYFSAHGGVAETQHVFLAGNRLPERWQGRDRFTIGELGFGTGLNFLTTLQAWREAGAPGHLHYLAMERYPLTEPQWRTALAHHPRLQREASSLLDQLPLRHPGLHRLHFGDCTLTLAYGDAAELLPQIHAAVDAWFLDGFAPAKNPDMWTAGIFHQLARLSAPGATFASFTVARAVRDGLLEAGFTINKAPGFGHKRDMLVGQWYASGTAHPTPAARAKTAIIVGAGIAGCSTARALAERGLAVAVCDGAGIAAGASGNMAAALYPQLTRFFEPATQWHLTGYGFMLRQLARWRSQGLDFAHAQPGMVKIGTDADDEARLRRIHTSLQLDPSIAVWCDRAEASALLQTELAQGGFYFPHGSWIAPAELCAALLDYPNITFMPHAMQAVDSTQVTLENGATIAADCVILAHAMAAQLHYPALPLRPSAGQVTTLQGAPLPAILCHQGYAIARGDCSFIGATYRRDPAIAHVTEDQHGENLAHLRAAAPQLAVGPVIGGRSSLRATTPHRLPIVGRAGDGVYLSVGHGSRGMISAPLAAELLASEICQEPLPVSAELLAPLRRYLPESAPAK